MNGIETPRNFPNESKDDVVAEAERGRAAKTRKEAASKSSRFRGVSWLKPRKKWKVKIRVHGKRKTIGRYPNERDAARAYDAFVIANGINVPRNFPNEAEDAVVAEAERGRAAKKRKVAASMSSRFRGVSWHKREKKWYARFCFAGKMKHIGCFINEIDAAHAYDAYAIANGGDRQTDPSRNFDDEDEDEDDVLAEAARVRDAPKRRKNASSKSSHFRGVSWSEREKRWKVSISVAGKLQHLGSFRDEQKAGRAFDAYVVDNNLDRPLNFPVAAEEDGESS